jgi:hypothetical protein
MRRDRRVLLNYGVTMTLQWETEKKTIIPPTQLPNCPLAGVNFIDVRVIYDRFSKNVKTFPKKFWKQKHVKEIL